MSFQINDSYRLSINLSNFANYIIETDMITFRIETISTFINRILKNFIDKAKSTLSNSAEEYRAELEDKLKKRKINIDTGECKNMVNVLVNEYIDSVKNKKYKKGNLIKIRLNKDNLCISKGQTQIANITKIFMFLTAASNRLDTIFSNLAKRLK